MSIIGAHIGLAIGHCRLVEGVMHIYGVPNETICQISGSYSILDSIGATFNSDYAEFNLEGLYSIWRCLNSIRNCLNSIRRCLTSIRRCLNSI